MATVDQTGLNVDAGSGVVQVSFSGTSDNNVQISGTATVQLADIVQWEQFTNALGDVLSAAGGSFEPAPAPTPAPAPVVTPSPDSGSTAAAPAPSDTTTAPTDTAAPADSSAPPTS